MRPIARMRFADFLGVAWDEIMNQMTKMKYMFGGKIKMPLTMDALTGAGRRQAAQHSQSIEGMLMSIPGLKIVLPSNAYDAKGLLKTAIRDDNPVIFLRAQDADVGWPQEPGAGGGVSHPLRSGQHCARGR